MKGYHLYVLSVFMKLISFYLLNVPTNSRAGGSSAFPQMNLGEV